MKVSIVSKEGELLAEWEVVGQYPSEYDPEDLDDESMEGAWLIDDVRDGRPYGSHGRDVQDEVVRLWDDGNFR